MKRSALSLFLTLLFSPVLFAQRIVEVSYTTDNLGNYHFIANNKAFCTYVLRVELPTMQNLKSVHRVPYEAEVKPGMNTLFVLSPVSKTEDTKVSFRASNRKGCMQPVPNPDFV